MDVTSVTSGNSSDSSVALLCSSTSSSSASSFCSEQRQLLSKEEAVPCAVRTDVTSRRKHSGGEYDSEVSVSSGGGCSALRTSSTPSSGASLFQQQFLQANDHASAAPAPIVQPNGGGFSPGAFSVPMDQMSINANGTPMQQAFAAAAAAASNNIGLFCTAPSASVPQFAPTAVPSGAFSLVSYGQRPPMVQQLAAVQQQRYANASGPNIAASRKNGSASAIHSSASTSASAASSSSINRSQRCGVCRGCQCKPCGQCTYCQDSPQFGGPGVKKQSCIERRCLRVLENRLQRDAPTFKARVGCNACEDCRSPDCQICLVCLDKRFFNGRYMQTTHPCMAPGGALCAKKRCNNATSLELPYSLDRPSLKRPSSESPASNTHHQQHAHQYQPHPQPHHAQQQMAKRQLIHASVPHSAAAINSNIVRILSAAQHGTGAEPKADKYVVTNVGRTSGGNSATNSPISENGGPLCDTPPSQQQQMLLGAARPLWSTAQQSAIVTHQTPPPMLVPLGVPYGAASFDQQMASLAAAAAVGFPSVQQNQHNFNSATTLYSTNNNNYPHKFLAYPKYEYFEEGAAAVAALGGGMVGEGMPAEHQQQHQPQLHPQHQSGGTGPRPGGGTDNGTADNNNPFVPPSYSAERKVVLQPL